MTKLINKKSDNLGRIKPKETKEDLFFGFFANLSEKTRSAYYSDLKGFREFLRKSCFNVPFEDVRMNHILSYKIFLEDKKISKVSINRKLSAISSFYQYLGSQEILSKNPCEFIKREKNSHEVIKTPCLTKEQVRKLFESIDKKTYIGALEYVLFAFMFHIPMRGGEIISLKLSSLREINGYLCLCYQGKGGREENKPLNSFCLEALYAYFEKVVRSGFKHEVQDFLFKGMDGGGLSLKTLNAIFSKHGQKIGLPFNLTSHSAKTTAITYASEFTDIVDLKNFASHSDVKMTMSYIQRKNEVEKSPSFKLDYFSD